MELVKAYRKIHNSPGLSPAALRVYHEMLEAKRKETEANDVWLRAGRGNGKSGMQMQVVEDFYKKMNSSMLDHQVARGWRSRELVYSEDYLNYVREQLKEIQPIRRIEAAPVEEGFLREFEAVWES